MRRASLPYLALVAATCTGCTHAQLGRSTLRQANTITDLQYKQVLNNLASSHRNPDVLPHFAVVGTGGTSVNDQASVNVELEWMPSAIAREMLAPGVARAVEEQWTLAPIIHPDKLRAIRCVYQLVVRGRPRTRSVTNSSSPSSGEGYMKWVQRGWYSVGGRRDVPKDACYVGHCGDTYVWVTPDGLDGLSRLTLVVLNIATLDPNPPPAQPTKVVRKYNYKDGKLDTIETYTRPDPDAPRATAPPTRRDLLQPAPVANPAANEADRSIDERSTSSRWCTGRWAAWRPRPSPPRSPSAPRSRSRRRTSGRPRRSTPRGCTAWASPSFWSRFSVS